MDKFETAARDLQLKKMGSLLKESGLSEEVLKEAAIKLALARMSARSRDMLSALKKGYTAEEAELAEEAFVAGYSCGLVD